MILKIEKLIYGGYGLARTDKKVIFVKGGVPGDEVDAEIIEEKRNFIKAKINNVIRPSRHRVSPKCEYFGKCGGCQWQNISYDFQLKTKESILLESLERITGIKNSEIESTVASQNEYNYRNRLTVHLDSVKGKHVLGFREEKSHGLVPIQRCPISSENISQIIQKISILLSNYKSATLPFDKIFISDICNYPSLSISSRKDVPESEIKKLFFKLKEHLQFVKISFTDKQEKSFQFETGKLKFISSPSVFAQANSYVNEKLIETIAEWTRAKRYESALDLFCGYGNISLHVARNVRRLIGIDHDSRAIKFANKNAKLNSIKNCRFEAWDVKKYLHKYKSEPRPDLIIIDPPRNGAKEIIKPIINLNPKNIIYVSCNPTTLARDLKDFLKHGYYIKKMQLFDMFPQTYHMETLTILEIKKANLN